MELQGMMRGGEFFMVQTGKSLVVHIFQELKY